METPRETSQIRAKIRTNIGTTKKLFNALQCPKEWRVEFVGFYLKEEADLWWDTMKDKQYEPGFGRNRFKELLKNYIPCPS